MSVKMRIAGLISSSASTAAAIAQACQDGILNAEMPLVIANTVTAGERIRSMKHPPHIVVISRKASASREAFGDAILRALKEYRIDFFGQWGWDPLTPENVVDEYAGRCINQHTDLPTDFGGEDMNGVVTVCARLHFARALNRQMGVEPTAHWVDKELDKGKVLVKGFVSIDLKNDDCHSLFVRVKLHEHRVQIMAVDLATRGELREIEFDSPVRDGERGILEAAKDAASRHHAGETQSQVKATSV